MLTAMLREQPQACMLGDLEKFENGFVKSLLQVG